MNGVAASDTMSARNEHQVALDVHKISKNLSAKQVCGVGLSAGDACFSNGLTESIVCSRGCEWPTCHPFRLLTVCHSVRHVMAEFPCYCHCLSPLQALHLSSFLLFAV